MSDQEIVLSQVANVRQKFTENGFAFTDGKLGDKPRCFGLAKGCTLEFVGEAAVESATMVTVMAPNDLKLASVNGIRLSAFMALLAGHDGVRWASWALTTAGQQQGEIVQVEGTVGAWQLRLVSNRKKSTATLKVRAQT